MMRPDDTDQTPEPDWRKYILMINIVYSAPYLVSEAWQGLGLLCVDQGPSTVSTE